MELQQYLLTFPSNQNSYLKKPSAGGLFHFKEMHNLFIRKIIKLPFLLQDGYRFFSFQNNPKFTFIDI